MSTESNESGLSRRGFLHASGGALATGTAATAAGTAAAQEGEGGEGGDGTSTPTTKEVPDLDGYLDDTSNYDGDLTDATGQGEVAVDVGAPGNNGDFAFEPAAIHVDPGTTVTWEWTGEGGQHNVVHEGGDFESELTGEAGTTFEYTVEEAGVYKYYCDPHKALGMKGVVVAGEDYPTRTVEVTPAGAGGEGGGEGGTQEESAGDPMAANTLLAMLGLGFLSPIVFALVLRWRRPAEPVG